MNHPAPFTDTQTAASDMSTTDEQTFKTKLAQAQTVFLIWIRPRFGFSWLWIRIGNHFPDPARQNGP
jgi:hypothetical protein